MDAYALLWAATMNAGTVLALASLGLLINEKAGVVNLGAEGMVLSALLMSMFYIGGELAQSRLGLPRSLTGVFQGLLLFTLLACDTLMHYRIRRVAREGGH